MKNFEFLVMAKEDGYGNFIQAFTPDPTKSSNIVISSGASHVLDISDWIFIRWMTEDGSEVKRFINNNTAYWIASGDGIVVNEKVDSIKFTNNNVGSVTICIEGL